MLVNIYEEESSLSENGGYPIKFWNNESCINRRSDDDIFNLCMSPSSNFQVLMCMNYAPSLIFFFLPFFLICLQQSGRGAPAGLLPLTATVTCKSSLSSHSSHLVTFQRDGGVCHRLICKHRAVTSC